MASKCAKRRMKKYNLGGWINDNQEGVMGGLKIAGGIASQFVAPGNPLGVSLITSGAGDVLGEVRSDMAPTEDNQNINMGTRAVAPENPFNPVFAKGGVMKKNYSKMRYKRPLGGLIPYGNNYHPNAELERGEPYRLPNGNIDAVPTTAPTHAQGGVDMNLPSGTEVLGKGKIPGTDETFKEVGRKLERLQKRHERILKNNPTPIAARTSQRMLKKVQREYDNLMAQQKSVPGSKYAKGGKIPKYASPTKENNWMTVQNESDQDLMPWMTDVTGYGVNSRPLQSRTLEQGLGVNPPTVDQEFQRVNATPTNNVSTTPEEQTGNYGELLGTAATYAPIAYNAFQGIFGRPQTLDAEDYQNPYEAGVRELMSNRRFNVDPLLEQNRIASRIANRNLRDAGLGQGRFASNVAATQAARMRADSSVLAKKQNIDNQYRAEEASTLGNLGQVRADRRLAIKDVNDRNRAAQRRYLPTALSQLQQAAQVNRVRSGQEEADLMRINALNSLLSNYQFMNGFLKYTG